MAFISINNRIALTPLVLVGPILRKVTKRSVSVFVITKQNSVVKLVVKSATNATVLTQTSNTISLGENVHAIVITAKANSDVLQSNSVYTYNLHFDGIPMVNSNGELSDGILINSNYQLPEGIAYNHHILPSFVLPANDLDQLKFVHGSCRKPHGGKTDALRGLDSILSSSIINGNTPSQINKRPQFLCLTGDQMYADDVADPLLYMIIDLEENLFNWGSPKSKEVLPNISEDSENLRPGMRYTLVGEKENDTSPGKFSQSEGHAKSHLIKLAEYYGMYLLVWSDVLWPNLDIDSFSSEGDANPNDDNTGFPPFLDLFPNKSKFENLEKYEGFVFAANVNIPSTREDIVTEEYKVYIKESTALFEFFRSLKYVRKALANIPTYMMFDDHEITDDWFITKKWTQNTLLAGSLTKRIIQNGLCAFAVFQAWGNTPDLFDSGVGRTILNQLSSLNSNGGNNQSVFYSLGILTLPILNSDDTKLINGFEWQYNIDFDSFKLIFLDTRTQRGYTSNEKSPELISIDKISQQIDTSTSNRLAIIVSPAPVFGDKLIEEVQGFVGNVYSQDKEAWSFNENAYERLLDRISKFESSLILSGDVHYAFGASIKYWNNRTSSLTKTTIGQLCSSSLKNSDYKTEIASYVKPRVDPASYDYLGWNNPGYHIFHYDKDGRRNNKYVRGIPAVHLVFDNRFSTAYDEIKNGSSPKWRYRLVFHKDNRPKNQRLSSNPTALGSSNSQANSGYKHYNRYEWGGHRAVVGRDNICVVWFKNNGQNVVQEYWYVLGSSDNSTQFILQPSTIHEIDISPPSSSDRMPGN